VPNFYQIGEGNVKFLYPMNLFSQKDKA